MAQNDGLSAILDRTKSILALCGQQSTTTLPPVRRTSRHLRLALPSAASLIPRCTSTDMKAVDCTRIEASIAHSLSAYRQAIVERYTTTMAALRSIEGLGGVSDAYVENQVATSIEALWVDHIAKVRISVAGIASARSGEAPGGTAFTRSSGFSTSSTELLEWAFSIHDHIDSAETAYLARVSGITQDQCRTWFQNRRQRHRNLEKRAAEVGTTPPPPLRGAPHHPRKISALPRRCDPARTQGNGHTGDVKREGGEIAPATPRTDVRAGKTGRQRKIKGLPKRGRKKGGNREQVQEDGGPEEVEQGLIVQEGSFESSSDPSISTASDGSYGTSPIFDSPIDMYNNQYPTNDVLVPHGLVFGEYSYDFPSQQGQDGQEGLYEEIGEDQNRFAGMGFELNGLGQVGQAGGQVMQVGEQNEAQAVAAFGAAISQLNMAYNPSLPFPFPFGNDTNTTTNVPLLSANIPPTSRGSSTGASLCASMRSTPSLQSSAGVMDNMLDPFASFDGVVGVEGAEAAMEEWARLVSSSEMDVVMSDDGSQTGEGEGETQRTEDADAGALEGEEQEEELDLSVLEELQSYIDISDSPSSSPLSSPPSSYSSSPINCSPNGASPVKALALNGSSSSPTGTGGHPLYANTAGVYDINAVLLDALSANVDFGAGALDLGVLSNFDPTSTQQQFQAGEGMDMIMDMDMEGNLSMLDLLPFFNEQDTGFGIDLSLLPPVPSPSNTASLPASLITESPIVPDDRAALGHGTPSQPLPLPFVLPSPPATRGQFTALPASSMLSYEAMIGSDSPNMANMADAGCRREMADLEAAMIGMNESQLSEILAGAGVGVQPQDGDRQGEQWRYVDPTEGLHSAHIYGAAQSAPQGSGHEQQQEQDIGMDVEVEQEQDQAEPSSPWTPRRIPSNASFTSNTSITSADSYASYASCTSTASDASASSSVSAASTSTRIITPAGAHTPAVVLHTPPYEERRYGIFAFGEEEVGAEGWKGGRAPTPGEILDAYYA